MLNTQQNIKTRCYHCGDECTGQKVQHTEKVFCCNGCLTVYQILNSHDMCEYYQLNTHPGQKQNNEIRKGKFDYLDNTEIANQLVQFQNEKEIHITFYLPQIHCSSCLWLLENLHTLNEKILSSRVQFAKKELSVVIKKSMTLKSLAELLTKLGYEPVISLENATEKIHKSFDRRRWIKIGVTGFCFANIMMFSFPEYLAGKLGVVESNISFFLRYMSLILSVPVLIYGASEFFKSAYKGLAQKYLNIDAPVALALLITFIRSVYEIVTHTGSGYLDSMSGIVFFMLIGRWLQDRTYNSINFDRDFRSFFPIAVHKIVEGIPIPVEVNNIAVNDVIQIHQHEILPVDAILSKGEALIDYSFVTGESNPVKIQKGEIIYAGGKQLSSLIELVVIKPVSQSYLTSLWNKDAFSKSQKQTSPIVDKFGKYFTYLVLITGAIAFGYWYLQHEPAKMWNAFTTVLIVACPCALLLAENFTYGNIIRILNLNQFYVKGKQSIEKLIGIQHIIFDKTGTLTHYKSSRVSYEGALLNDNTKLAIVSVARQSSHPAAIPIQEYLGIKKYFEVVHFKEHQGEGVEAWIDEKHYKIGKASFVNTQSSKRGTEIFVAVDNQILGKFILNNQYRVGIENILKSLKEKYILSVLSGDNDAERTNLERISGKETELIFHQSPNDKLQYIQQLQLNQKVMMIGDGLNDAGALKQSNMGIAVSENNNLFTPACDAILEAGSLHLLPSLLKFCISSRLIILVTFIISAVYNIIGLSYAVQGVLSPVIAAILMPCSTVTIVLLTTLLSNKSAKNYSLKTKAVS